ncbi:MAG: hypothetical protein NXH75_15605, partial [Halobacteriovoraceae bacterium]|nr:hypothetical protein [Halobacteriovoraceae bacterium]
SVFYYYGEHFPAHKEYRLDLSGGANSTYGLTKLLKLMRAFGGFQISIFHTCYLNALDFIGPILSLSNEVVVPQKAILNTPLNTTGAFSETYLKDFSNRLIQDNSNHDRYKLLKYKKEAKDLYHRILELNQLVSPDYWEKMLNHFHSGDEAVLKDLSSQAFVLRDWSDAEEKEVFLPFYDYINLIDRYLLEGEHKLDYIDQLIDQNPHLMDLFILLPEPLS